MNAGYTAEEVARILGVSRAALRSCLRAVRLPLPLSRRPSHYTFQDLLLLKTTKSLFDARIPATRTRRMLASLKRQLPEGQPLYSVKIYADGRRIIVWDGTARWQPDSGQFLFDFDPQAIGMAVPLRLPRKRPQNRTAQQWVDLARELEHHSPEEARQAYCEAIALDPASTEAAINLGRLYYEGREWNEAEGQYRRALAHDPLSALAHFNLAIVLEARGERAQARNSYRDAIACDGGFAEAHYNLALLYEADCLRRDAIRHFAEAQKLLGLRRGPARGRNRLRKDPFPPRNSA